MTVDGDTLKKARSEWFSPTGVYGLSTIAAEGSSLEMLAKCVKQAFPVNGVPPHIAEAVARGLEIERQASAAQKELVDLLDLYFSR